MARKKGAKYFDVTSVNPFTKKILEKFSFKGISFSKSPIYIWYVTYHLNIILKKCLKVIYSLPYADYRENDEELFINIKPENDTCYYMAAKLWKIVSILKIICDFSVQELRNITY